MCSKKRKPDYKQQRNLLDGHGEGFDFACRSFVWYRPIVHDTGQQALCRYQELLRELSPQRRLQLTLRLTASARAMSVAGIRRDFPELSLSEVRMRLAQRLYGEEVAAKYFRSVP